MTYIIYTTEQEKLKSAIDLGITGDNYLTFRAYEVSGTEILFDEPVVYAFETSAVSATGNISLYKENYNNIDGTADLVPINDTSSTLIYITGIGSQPSNLFNFNYITFDPADPYYISLSNINLDIDTTYIITFKNLGVLETESTSAIRFRVVNTQLNKSFEKVFNTEVNDIISKASILSNLLDADKVFTQSDKDFNFRTPIVTYSSDTQDYRPSTEDVLFDNSQTIEELFLKQYLYDWQNYFADLSDPDNNANKSSDTGLKTREDLQQLKTIIAKNAYLFNQFKGNEIGMEYIADIFASGLAYQFQGIDVNIYRAFNYTVTSNLPYEFWVSDIKPIVHPIPWNVYYDYINEDTSRPYINFDDYYKIFIQKFNSLYNKCFSYIEFWDRPYNQYFTNTTFHQNMELQDVDSHMEYRFKDNGYLVSYDVSAVLNDPSVSGHLVVDQTDYRFVDLPYVAIKTYVMLFDKDGIADKYIWRLFRRDNPNTSVYNQIYEMETYENSFAYSFDSNKGESLNLFKIECVILNAGYSTSVWKIN